MTLLRLILTNRSNFIPKVDNIRFYLTVGIILNHKVGEYVKKGETLATIFYNEKKITEEEVLSCFNFSEKPVEKPKLIIDTIK